MARDFDGANPEYLQNDNVVITSPPFAFVCWFNKENQDSHTTLMVEVDDAINDFWYLRLRKDRYLDLEWNATENGTNGRAQPPKISPVEGNDVPRT